MASTGTSGVGTLKSIVFEDVLKWAEAFERFLATNVLKKGLRPSGWIERGVSSSMCRRLKAARVIAEDKEFSEASGDRLIELALTAVRPELMMDRQAELTRLCVMPRPRDPQHASVELELYLARFQRLAKVLEIPVERQGGLFVDGAEDALGVMVTNFWKADKIKRPTVIEIFDAMMGLVFMDERASRNSVRYTVPGAVPRRTGAGTGASTGARPALSSSLGFRPTAGVAQGIPARPEFTGECHYCHGKGHKANQCPLRPKEQGAPETGTSKPVQQATTSATMTSAAAAASALVPPRNPRMPSDARGPAFATRSHGAPGASAGMHTVTAAAGAASSDVLCSGNPRECVCQHCKDWLKNFNAQQAKRAQHAVLHVAEAVAPEPDTVFEGQAENEVSETGKAVCAAMEPMEMHDSAVQALQTQEVAVLPAHLRGFPEYEKWFAEEGRQHPGRYMYLSRTGKDGWPIGVLCDTGADRPYCSKAYAEFCGMDITKGPTIQLDQSGHCTSTDLYAKISVKLCDDGQLMPLEVVVNDVGTDFVLVPSTFLEKYRQDKEEGKPVRVWPKDGTRVEPEIVRSRAACVGDGIIEALPGDERELLPSELFGGAGKQDEPEEKRPTDDELREIAEAVAAMPSPHPEKAEARAETSEPGEAQTRVEVTAPSGVSPQEVGVMQEGAAEEKKETTTREDRVTGCRPLNEVLSEIRFDPGLTTEQRSRLEQIVAKHLLAFGYANSQVADLPVCVTRLKPNHRVVFSQPRRLPPKKQEAVSKWMTAMVEAGIYERLDNNDWASPVTVVPKTDGYRVCGDYTEVNKQVLADAGPMPNARQKMATFRKCRFFATFDMENGYLQGPLDKLGQRVFAVITDAGVFGPRRPPYGITNGPVWFHNAIARLIREILGAESVFDDVGIGAETFDEFCDRLEQFLRLVIAHNIKLKAKKTVLGAPVIHFVGRLVGGDRIDVDRERMSGWMNAEAPRDKVTMLSWLCAVQWLNNFIPALAGIIDPLWPLVNGKTEFKWSAECQKSFEAVQRILREEPTWLEHPVLGAILVLRADACIRGIAVALLQYHVDEKRVGPIAFFSRKLKESEKHYATVQLEALAVVWGLGKCREFINYYVVIVTDHSNLQFMRTSANAMVQRWSLALMEYDTDIVYMPGRTNFLCDFLCRALRDESATASINVLMSAVHPKGFLSVKEQRELAQVVATVPHRVEGGKIVCTQPVPADARDKIFVLAHDIALSGHTGKTRTLQRVLDAISWPGVEADIHRLCRDCPLCQKLHARDVRTEELAELPPRSLHEGWYVDFSGPFPRGEYVMAVVDRFSHWCWLFTTEDVRATTAAERVFQVIVDSCHWPRFLTSDGGASFTGKIFEDMCRALEIEHHVSLPHHPEGHSAVERLFRDVNGMIRSLVAKGVDDWAGHLKAIQYALNTGFSRTLGMSPFEVVFGRKPHTTLRAMLEQGQLGLMPPIDEDAAGDVIEFSYQQAKRAAEIAKLVEGERERVHESNARLWAAKARGRAKFDKGSYVLRRVVPKDKTALHWDGPFRVVEKATDVENAYVIEDLDSLQRSTEAVANLHAFRRGGLTVDQLRAESAQPGKHFVERVRGDLVDDDGELWFLVDWRGYPPSDPEDASAWVSLQNGAWLDVIKDYIKRNRLGPAVAGRRRRVGPLPRS